MTTTVNGKMFDKHYNSLIRKLVLKMLFADYYIGMVLPTMPISLIFCQEFLCAVFASEGSRLIFRHSPANMTGSDNI
jgi:hypothetical protein